MGNIHVFSHRFPALVTALLCSLALAFVSIAGTSCSFLDVTASEGRYIENTNDSFQTGVTSASFGVLCETDLFDSNGDTMWTSSRVFLIISLVVGSLATAIAWILTGCVPPTDRSWKIVSIMAALSAVLNIPIYLIFESEPCTMDESRQQCSLAFGSYILMAGALSSVASTIITQCLDPPQWGDELDAWKVRAEHESYNGLSRGLDASDDNDEEDRSAKTAAAGTIGLFDLVSRWDQRRRGTTRQSRDVTPNTSGEDMGDDVNVPFAAEGSYYASSTNSRLLLKVTPDGKRIGDDQRSFESFGDLDDDVELAEQERSKSASDNLTTTSLDIFMDSASMPESEQESQSILVILPFDATKRSKSVSAEAWDGTNILESKYSDEAQFYSEMKLPSTTRDDKSLIDHVDAEDEQNDSPRKKLSQGIRSLSHRIIRDKSRRSRSGAAYAMMVSDGEESSAGGLSLTTDNAKQTATDDESDGSRSAPGSDHLHHQKLVYDWNALHAAANAGILLAQDANSDSSEEDEPATPYFSEPSTEQVSSSSHGHRPDEDDGDSLYSDSSLSDVSDAGGNDGNYGDVYSPSPRARLRSSRKSKRRKSKRKDSSSAHSVSSYTSLLDHTISEETYLELKECESGDDSPERGHPGGYRSAPESREEDHPPYTFVYAESYPATTERGYIHPKLKLPADTSWSSKSSPANENPLLGAGVVPVVISPEKQVRRMERRNPKSEPEDDGLYMRRCRSMSIPRRKKNATVHPIVTPPKSALTPTSSFEDIPPETIRPFREDRMYKGGIQSRAVYLSPPVSDAEGYMTSDKSTKSVKSSTSQRARQARMRRLQRDAQRTRSRTLDPPKSRRISVNGNDLPTDQSKRDNPTRDRILFSSGNYRDYDSDEASL